MLESLMAPPMAEHSAVLKVDLWVDPMVGLLADY